MPNYVLQEMSEEMGDGKKKVYPRMQTYSLHDFDTVVRHMHEYSGSFSEGAIRGVLDALVTTMKSWMPMGHSIKIDGLGVFSLTLGFDTSTPSEATATKKQKSGNADEELKTKYRHVCIKGIRFKPDPQLLRQMNKEATFERTETGVVVPRKTSDSRDERIRKALAIIDKQGYMTLSDYAIATSQSRSTASKDLRQLVSDPTSGLVTHGSHSHKVWIRNKKTTETNL
ncbi:MAG: hypothetical protein IKH01_04035 [Prevotella sp.]|nr:hypothetical protein [Prevotella sp.]